MLKFLCGFGTVVHGNRTRQQRLSAPFTGFEDRAGHQVRRHYRAELWHARTKAVNRGADSEQVPKRLLERVTRLLVGAFGSARGGRCPCSKLRAVVLFVNDDQAQPLHRGEDGRAPQ